MNTIVYTVVNILVDGKESCAARTFLAKQSGCHDRRQGNGTS